MRDNFFWRAAACAGLVIAAALAASLWDAAAQLKSSRAGTPAQTKDRCPPGKHRRRCAEQLTSLPFCGMLYRISKRMRILGSACNTIGGLIGVPGRSLGSARLMLVSESERLVDGSRRSIHPAVQSHTSVSMSVLPAGLAFLPLARKAPPDPCIMAVSGYDLLRQRRTASCGPQSGGVRVAVRYQGGPDRSGA